MRVLVVHNRYSSRVPSGENMAVDDEVRWLREAGVDVLVHEATNDDLVESGIAARVRGGLEAVWSARAQQAVIDLVERERPDVVHVHNLFPLLTGSVAEGVRRRGVPVVWTVHNRRVRCVAGGYFRDDAPCHDCRHGWRVPGIVHGCYSDSRLASAVVTVGTTLFRNVARQLGVTPVAISHAIADWLIDDGGFARDRVCVKYNGVAGSTTAPAAEQQSAFVFLGRLSAYKGVHLLLDAWRRADVMTQLRIVGDGDLRDEVRAAATADPRITWVGQIGLDAISDQLATARAVVVPSVWDEPFGRAAAEALAHGRPVITTGHAGLSEIVDDTCGWSTGNDPVAMAVALREAASSDRAVAAKARAATRRHSETFSPEATTAALTAIYEHARDEHQNPRPGPGRPKH
jgi:glycosyltransferase involved in cell wall biosynthesis